MTLRVEGSSGGNYSEINSVVLVVVMSDSFATSWTVFHQAPLSMRYPSKTTGIGWYFLLQGIFYCIAGGFFTDWGTRGLIWERNAGNFVLLNVCTQSLLALCDHMDCSPPGCSLHGISQARILEWVAISFSRGSSQPRDRTWISCIGRRILYLCHLRSPLILSYIAFSSQSNGTVSWWRVFKLEFEFYLQFLLHSSSVVVFGFLIS